MRRRLLSASMIQHLVVFFFCVYLGRDDVLSLGVNESEKRYITKCHGLDLILAPKRHNNVSTIR
ncbi:hypothetical protein AB9M62_31760 [Bacillales bacterium AN1005]